MMSRKDTFAAFDPAIARFADADSEKWDALTSLLLAWNEKINLTAITDPVEIERKHYADSLIGVNEIPQGAALLDVGCGGGFPSLPLAIARPDIRVTSLDSTAKKLRFVEAAATALSLPVTTLPGRAEELGRDPRHRERFDAVTARAVARLPILCEWCLPFVKIGGIFLALKGAAAEEELREAQNAVTVLGGRLEKTVTRSLDGDTRTLICIRKIAPTPEKYPRPGGQIVKKPL